MLQLHFRALLFRALGASLACVTLSACGQAAPKPVSTPSADASQVVPVRLVKQGNGYSLLRNGKPYFIKGAGGDGSKPLLKSCGANSFRTWGADNLEPSLAEAQKLGLTVTAGIWLGHKDNGFDYHNPPQVAAQFESAHQAILRYRSSPSLLLWAIGNEMESGQEDDPAVWVAVEQIALLAKKLDPNHPTMTVVAEIGGSKIASINRYCPDIDIVGINSYAGAASIPARYHAAGGVKPYVITEFGPPGTWEQPKNAWGVVPELTSTEKAKWYRKAYEDAIVSQPLCLGSYAFTWGNKQEATATWYGMLLPDGSRLGPVDTMTALWSGKPAANPCPVIHSLKLVGAGRVEPGTQVEATLNASAPETSAPKKAQTLKVDWVLQADPITYHTGGGAEGTPPTFPEAIVQADALHAKVKMPVGGGGYRLYAYVHGEQGGAAVANVPLFVTGSNPIVLPGGAKASLPLVLAGTGGAGPAPYTPSGYMGNAAALSMDEHSTDNPHVGKTCLKATYSAPDSWGGVVWQSPANDWGDLPGGWNLAGAKALTFWARGAHGGEVVSFQYGLLGKEKTYPDTGTGRLDKAVLTKAWKQYTINLQGQDLSRIKTGFAWIVNGSGSPVVFYLDDIRYQ